MSVRSLKHNVPALSMRGALTSSTANAETRTVEVMWSTGAPVLRRDWEIGSFYEELSLDPKHVRMGRLTSGTAPFLVDHNGYSVESALGVVERAAIVNGKGTATIRFAAEGIDPRADVLFRKIKDGIVKNVSVGYRTYKFEKVEGGDSKTPTYRATDWEPHEISAVAMGAEQGAGFRAETTDSTNECEFISRGMPQERNTMSEEEKKAAADKLALEQRNAELKAAADAAAEIAVRAERERCEGIRVSVRAAKLGDELASKMIADATPLDEARRLVLDAMAKRDEQTPTTSNITMTVTDDQQDKFVRGVSAWLFEKAGNGLVAKAKEKNVKGFEKVETDGGEFRGMSLLDVARECLERRGVSTRHLYNKMELVSKAMNHRSSGAATSDFAVLFENVMYKQMRAAYAVQSDTWKRFCKTDTVSDFRNSNRFLNGSFGALDLKPENAEYQNKAIPDGAKTSISVQTYGNMIGISREALINDDMGALADVAARFGRAAGLTIEKAVYTMLALNSGLGPTMSDAQPFFHANRSNVTTSAALSVAALSADKVAMRAQQDISSNEYLDLVPTILLVPTALEDPAKVLNRSAFDPVDNKFQKPNAVLGLFDDIVSSPRLSWSTTRRYLFTGAKEAFVVAFLEGAGEGPTMESQQGWRVDALEWKARIDFKAQPFDPKTALTNAGT